MPLEVLVLDGKGRIELTGSLGDVMKESAKIAVSYCRSVADKYGIDKDFYEKKICIYTLPRVLCLRTVHPQVLP